MTKRQIRLHQFLIRTNKFKNKQEILSYLEENRITVNNKIINSPDYHLKFSDEVKLDNEKLIAEKKNKYILLNKPKGYLSSRLTKKDIQLNKKSLFDLIEKDPTLFCVGRLDEDSEGLIIITNDGKLSHLITSPKYNIIKTYLVELNEVPNNDLLSKLKKGITYEGQILKPVNIETLNQKNKVLVQLNEGKKREIRIMFQHIGYEITRLTRIKIGELDLGSLHIPVGKTKEVEKEYILKKLILL